MSREKQKPSKKSTAKPVSIGVEVRLPKDSQPAKATILSSGSIEFLDADGVEIVPEYMVRNVGYERPKKPKIQSRWRVDGSQVTVGGLSELAEFHHLFAIDTGTRQIGADKVSVAVSFGFQIAAVQGGFEIQPDPTVNVYEIRNATGNPEMLAGLRIAHDILKAPGLPKNIRLAILTDSELGAHDEINSRRVPIYGSHFLPEQFTLVYSSGETGSEFARKMIEFCDKQGAVFFDELACGKIGAKPYESMPEDKQARMRFFHLNGTLEAKNPKVEGLKLGPNSTVTLYGIPEKPDN